MKFFLLKLIISVTSVLLITSCAKIENFPQITANYIASEQLNPDLTNHPSPLVVNLYQLKTDTKFKDADFFKLFNDSKTFLGQDLLTEDQVEVKPNDQLETSIDLLPETRYIAVVAAYRDIDNSQWNKLLKIKNHESVKIKILLGRKDVVLQPSK